MFLSIGGQRIIRESDGQTVDAEVGNEIAVNDRRSDLVDQFIDLIACQDRIIVIRTIELFKIIN